MFKILINNSVASLCPNEQSLVMFALIKAMDHGISKGPIHDKQTAIEYLNSIGIAIEEVANETQRG